MSNLDSRTVVEQTLQNILEQVPALKPLKIVGAVEVTARGDVQVIRVEMPGLKVTKGDAREAKVRVEIRRDILNEMIEGNLDDWIRAFDHGMFRPTGVEAYLKLIGQVIIKADRRQKLHTPAKRTS